MVRKKSGVQVISIVAINNCDFKGNHIFDANLIENHNWILTGQIPVMERRGKSGLEKIANSDLNSECGIAAL